MCIVGFIDLCITDWLAAAFLSWPCLSAAFIRSSLRPRKAMNWRPRRDKEEVQWTGRGSRRKRTKEKAGPGKVSLFILSGVTVRGRGGAVNGRHGCQMWWICAPQAQTGWCLALRKIQGNPRKIKESQPVYLNCWRELFSSFLPSGTTLIRGRGG